MSTIKTVITMPIGFAIKNGLDQPAKFEGDFHYNGKTFHNMRVIKTWGHKSPTLDNVSFEIEYDVA